MTRPRDDRWFEPEPWQVRERTLDLEQLACTESIFALANGHLGLRGNLDEGEPFGLQGTYLSGYHEVRSLPYAEAGYGFPESGESVINVSNGKIMRLLVDDEPFDIRYGTLRSHERTLDLAAGVLRRELEWESASGQRVRVRSTRLVSFTQRAVAAIRYEVEPIGASSRVVVQSELLTNEPQHHPASDDPRAAATLEAPLQAEDAWYNDARSVLVHRCAVSGLRVAAAMDHRIDCPAETETETDCSADMVRFSVSTDLQAGESLVITKYLGYGWSSIRSVAAMRDQSVAAITAARSTGWDGLVAEQRAYLDDFWRTADVEITGHDALQQAVRYCAFQVLQAGARTEGQGIAAKGLTGTGYDGHSFWDSDAFVLPMLAATVPGAARHALTWRRDTLPIAREHARALRLAGAAFPWRTISGNECSGYWPAGTAAFHVNAAVADAASIYVGWTGDVAFEASVGLELLTETARLWVSLGHYRDDGSFHIDGVTGPDEYSAITDDNVYTNLMARRNLRCAADAATRHADPAASMGITDDEIAAWAAAAEAMSIPYDEALGVHPQALGFTDHQRWDFGSTETDQYPLFQSFPYFDLYRKQVTKQADLVLAMDRCPEAFEPDQVKRNFAYYEGLTVRDSSLSASTQAVVAASIGHLDLALDYLAESALVDLGNLHGNTTDGLHVGSSAGAWAAVACGFGGMRLADGGLTFTPRCPGGIGLLSFGVVHHGRRIRVQITPAATTYRTIGDERLTISHHGVEVEVTGTPVELENPTIDAGPPPTQPKGRAPLPAMDRRWAT